MAILTEQDRATITQMFEQTLQEPVRLAFFTIPSSSLIVPGRETCESCGEVQALLEELVEISPKLTLEIHNIQQERELATQYGVERVPAVLVLGPESGGVRFFGAPAGYEFATLIQDIQSASQGKTRLAPATREALAAIPDPIHIQVFVTPT
ncbi:MAG: hypothetical protein QOF51_2043 [Chloroflexota bacterium]|jgi:alkyl hydroperoxide reductase subunit AhpF|nr:hypothetical protein [Chloroflexota bacterium]